MMPRLTFLCLLLALAGCGTRGNLTLPPGPPPAPLLGGPASPLKPARGQTSPPIQPAAGTAENTSPDPKVTAQ